MICQKEEECDKRFFPSQNAAVDRWIFKHREKKLFHNFFAARCCFTRCDGPPCNTASSAAILDILSMSRARCRSPFCVDLHSLENYIIRTFKLPFNRNLRVPLSFIVFTTCPRRNPEVPVPFRRRKHYSILLSIYFLVFNRLMYRLGM